jgi:hypothetical protein
VGAVHGGGTGRRGAPGLRRGELAAQPLDGRPRHRVAAAQSLDLTARLDESGSGADGHDHRRSAHAYAHADADSYPHIPTDPNAEPHDQALAVAVTITVDTYSHAIPAMQEEEALIAALVFSPE